MASSGRFTWNVVRFSVFTAVAALGLVAGVGLIQALATNGLHARATVDAIARACNVATVPQYVANRTDR